jgi:choline dehydrogenase-like flavoprotein
MAAREYDLIVVGAGMAGIIAAARIAEQGINPSSGDRLRVALLEAGPHVLRGTPRPGYGDPQNRRMIPQILWEEFAMAGQWPWTFGLKAVGGCSLHWGCHVHLPFAEDYANWSAMGIRWTRDDMKEAVEDITRNFHVEADPEEAYTRGERMFREAATAMGHRVIPVLTTRKNCIYCGFHNESHGCKYDSKATSLWYLPTALNNGVELIDRAEVRKVLIERQGAAGRVRGVVYERDGAVEELRADKVIVSCGTWGSPVLLARSGYGPREQLGDSVIVENDNVGRNLDGDTAFRVPMYFPEPIKEAGRGTNSSIGFFLGDPQYTDGTGFVRISTAELSYINYPHISALSEFAPAFGKPHMDFMRTAVTRLGAISILFNRAPLHVKGRLNLRTGAQSYPGDPYIDRRMQEAKEVVFQLARKMGAKYSTRFPASFAGRGGGHTNGTCRAGSDRRNSVINGDFESHDVRGLFVVDASSYPRASVNSGLFAAIMGAFGARRIVATHFSRGAGRG